MIRVSHPRCPEDIGLLHVKSATLININTGRVFDRPTLNPSHDWIELTPAELAHHVIAFPPTGYYLGWMVALLARPLDDSRLAFKHVDCEYPHDYIPVQPNLDRLTAFLRRRIAMCHWRQEFIIPVLAMALHPRIGQGSPIRQLDMDCLKYILAMAV